MIISAGNTPLNNTNAALPNMANTITSWFLNITFDIVERVLDGADWTENTTQTINTRGVVQPPRDKDLKIFPEGTWAWEWLMLHCLPDVQLEVNQYVRYDGTLYKVMAKKNWQKYGYCRYMLLEAFKADLI
ncbi:MAG: hypothetical protein IIW86_01915 [Clostridia bacterium]|nr:hypothetical protein [Clostridia bacterium]